MEQTLTLHRHFTAIKPHVDVTAGSLSSIHSVTLDPNLVASTTNDDNVRERLKRHHNEVAVGKVVMIPDKWSHEEMLKDWLDFGSFDALLAPKGFELARAALIEERRSQAMKEEMESSNSKGYIGKHFKATRCS